MMNVIQKKSLTSNQQFHSTQQELFVLLDHLPSMVSIINKELIYEFCNKTFLHYNQKQLKDVIGRSIKDVCIDSFHSLEKHIQTVLNGQEVIFQEELTICKKIRVIDAKFTPRYDCEGKVNGYFSYIKDVTKEKKLEKKLVESKERLNIIQSLTKIGGWYYDFKTEKVWWSKGTYDLFRVDKNEEITFPKFLSYLPEDDQKKLINNWSKALQEKTDFNINHRIVNGNHTTLAKGLATFFYKNNEPQYAVGATIDITDSEHSRLKLQQSEERFELAITGTNAGIWDWNIQTGETIYHEQCANILGYSSKELAPSKIYTLIKLLHPQDRKKSNLLLQEHFNGKNKFYEDEARMKHKNGEWIWVEYRGQVSSWSKNGEPLRISGILIDITNRKNAEFELKSYKDNLKELVREQTKELKEINTELESFAYSISHDLRTPLRYIEGFSKLLKRKIVIDDEETERYFSHISEGIQNMSNMIDALLNLSRLGRKNLNKEVVNLNEVVAEAIKELAHVSDKRNINWEVGKLPVIFGDPALILMVFENLISNAIKFTKNKKLAHIAIQVLETPDKKGKTTIYIKDNGVGFNTNYASKLFGVFQRLHSQEEFEGTGIGLANVKKIIDKHDGFIRIEAEEEKGATFYITL